MAEGAGESSLGDYLGRDGIEGSAAGFMGQDPDDEVDEVTESYPAETLGAGSEGAAQAKAKGGKHGFERSSGGGKDHTRPEINGTDASALRGGSGVFPSFRDFA